jgi:ATP-dependent DNA helicase RecG
MQAVLMAPTELLAEQHYQKLGSGSAAGHARSRDCRARSPHASVRVLSRTLASGEVRIAVGTHALFQEGIEFAKLALIIVDEQHRFGVQQRLALHERDASMVVCHISSS